MPTKVNRECYRFPHPDGLDCECHSIGRHLLFLSVEPLTVFRLSGVLSCRMGKVKPPRVVDSGGMEQDLT